MEQRISLITLGVQDLALATAFYEALGWRRGLREAEGVSFFQAGGIVIGLWPATELAAEAKLPPADAGILPGARFALAHNVRERAEVNATLAEAEAAGATITKPGSDTPWGGYNGYFRDPEGFLWEVAWNPGFRIAADGSISLPE